MPPLLELAAAAAAAAAAASAFFLVVVFDLRLFIDDGKYDKGRNGEHESTSMNTCAVITRGDEPSIDVFGPVHARVCSG